MAQRANVLRAYRELIDLVRRLPAEKRDASLQEARKAMQADKNESNLVKQTDMLKQLVSKVSFLRMTTPKTYRDRCSCLPKYPLEIPEISQIYCGSHPKLISDSPAPQSSLLVQAY